MTAAASPVVLAVMAVVSAVLAVVTVATVAKGEAVNVSAANLATHKRTLARTNTHAHARARAPLPEITHLLPFCCISKINSYM